MTIFGDPAIETSPISHKIFLMFSEKVIGVRLGKITRRLCLTLTANSMAARVVLDSRLRGNDEFHKTPYFCASFPRKRESRKEKPSVNRTRMVLIPKVMPVG